MIDVLVVGAGPVGLAMACDLHRHRVYLIRPDGHVAFCCLPADAERFISFLGTIFT